MAQEQSWTDDDRTELLESIRSAIIGEVRLAKRAKDEIVEYCSEAYIADTCPENEHDKFIQSAADEFNRAVAAHESEKVGWPAVTDCDRLDRVEVALRDRGIIFWQASPCCDSCTVADLPDRIELINNRHSGFRSRVRGYAFFIDQTLPEQLADDTQLTVCLAYGWFSPDDSKVDPNAYEAKALGIAREVCECLRAEGFEPDWEGSFDRKIRAKVNWQRRTKLE